MTGIFDLSFNVQKSMMPTFQSNRFRPSSYHSSLGAFYRRKLHNYPFLLFGLPFIFTIVAGMCYSRRFSLLQHVLRGGNILISPEWMLRRSLIDTNTFVGSFILTPATALRYERHDRKVQQMTKEAELGISKNRRRVDINEEYYRLAAKVSLEYIPLRSLRKLKPVAGPGELGK